MLRKKVVCTTSIWQMNAKVVVWVFGALQIHSTRHNWKPASQSSFPLDCHQAVRRKHAVRRISLCRHVIHLLFSDLLQPCKQWMSNENDCKYAQEWREISDLVWSDGCDFPFVIPRTLFNAQSYTFFRSIFGLFKL